jgi:nucleolar protein 15
MVVKKASSEKKEKTGGSKKKDDVKKVADKSKKIKKDKEGKTSDKIPSAKKDAKAKPKGNRMVRRFNNLRLKNKDLDGSKGIVYIGHLPKGFEEKELTKFFGQFGTIQKLRVSRSKKTGRTRGYAFMEF